MKTVPLLPHDHGTGTLELLPEMPNMTIFVKVSDIFQLISDPSRLKILWLLCHSEDCVTNIGAALEMSTPAVSHHLRLLKQAGLLVSRRLGKEVHYTLDDTKEARLVHEIVDLTFEMNCKDRKET